MVNICLGLKQQAIVTNLSQHAFEHFTDATAIFETTEQSS